MFFIKVIIGALENLEGIEKWLLSNYSKNEYLSNFLLLFIESKCFK
jgi:hypothetical protein